MPSGSVTESKRKRRPKTEINQGASMQVESAISKTENRPVHVERAMIREGERVTRVVSKEIYDFSDG
jgi:hypothetical protein